MNSFKDPLLPLITDPVNVDRPIQELQQSFSSNLVWLEKSFGRSWLSFKSSPSNKKIAYPEVWQGLGKDLLNVMPNDNLNSQSFFKLEDPQEVVNWEPNFDSYVRTKVSIIFWFNLDAIVNNADQRFIETLKAQVLDVIKNQTFTRGSSIEVTRIWGDVDNVFRGYTFDKVKQQELVHPYGGFRIECNINHLQDCPVLSTIPGDGGYLEVEGGFLKL